MCSIIENRRQTIVTLRDIEHVNSVPINIEWNDKIGSTPKSLYDEQKWTHSLLICNFNGPFSNQHSNHSIYILVHQSIFREQCSENTFKNCLFTKFPAIHPKKGNNDFFLGMNTARSIIHRTRKKETHILYACNVAVVQTFYASCQLPYMNKWESVSETEWKSQTTRRIVHKISTKR